MYKVYDQVSSLKLPNGKVKTAEELRSDSQYDLLFDNVCAIDVNDSGVTTSFITIEDLKTDLNINEVDAQSIVSKANEIISNEIEMHRNETDQLQVEVQYAKITSNENQEAIGELGVLSADSLNAIGELGVSTATLLESNTQLTSANEDVLQAIGELGAMVAAMQVSPDTHSNAAGETA